MRTVLRVKIVRRLRMCYAITCRPLIGPSGIYGGHSGMGHVSLRLSVSLHTCTHTRTTHLVQSTATHSRSIARVASPNNGASWNHEAIIQSQPSRVSTRDCDSKHLALERQMK
jgi:hypothetical protein